MSGLIGAAPCLWHHRLPPGGRRPAVVEIGAGPFAAVVEEALVVVLRLKRLDLCLDEAIELGEITRQLRRDVEIHGSLLLNFSPQPQVSARCLVRSGRWRRSADRWPQCPSSLPRDARSALDRLHAFRRGQSVRKARMATPPRP